MAGDWIKMRANLQTHPKVVRISSALNADRLRTVGGLHAVWCLFDAHSTDGQLEGYTAKAIDDLIGWAGFSDALAAVGWLECSETMVELPEFDEHNSKSAKRRANETERKRKEREALEGGRNPSASDADKKRTREEKRREEKTEGKPSVAVAKRPAKKCPADFALDEDMREWAVEAAPLIDVDLETEKFKDHTFKTALSDWSATWRNWMRNAQGYAAQRPPARTGYGPQAMKGQAIADRNQQVIDDLMKELP